MRISLYKNHTIYDVLKKYPELISDIFMEYFPDYDDYDEEDESDYTEEPPADNEEEYIQQNFFND